MSVSLLPVQYEAAFVSMVPDIDFEVGTVSSAKGESTQPFVQVSDVRHPKQAPTRNEKLTPSDSQPVFRVV